MLVVYEYLDAAGKSLYVGMTNNFSRRDAQHRGARTLWTKRIDSAVLVFCESRYIAQQVEREAIQSRRPIANHIRYKSKKRRQAQSPIQSEESTSVPTCFQCGETYREHLASDLCNIKPWEITEGVN